MITLNELPKICRQYIKLSSDKQSFFFLLIQKYFEFFLCPHQNLKKNENFQQTEIQEKCKKIQKIQ